MTDFLPVLEKVLDGVDGVAQTGEASSHSLGELPNDGYIDHDWEHDTIERFIRAMH